MNTYLWSIRLWVNLERKKEEEEKLFFLESSEKSHSWCRWMPMYDNRCYCDRMRYYGKIILCSLYLVDYFSYYTLTFCKSKMENTSTQQHTKPKFSRPQDVVCICVRIQMYACECHTIMCVYSEKYLNQRVYLRAMSL